MRAYELMQNKIKVRSKESTELGLRMSESELTLVLGNESRKSELLSGKQKLNLEMIRKLNEGLHLPAEVLIQDY